MLAVSTAVREPLLYHLVVAGAIVALMTWVVMPSMTRWLAPWLSHSSSDSSAR